MMNGKMKTVLSCSRVVVRAFANGLHQNPSGQCSSSEVLTGLHHNARNLVSVAPLANKKDSALPKFVSTRCGFAKDLLGGPSTVFDQNVYGDDACFIATHKLADVVGVADGVGGWRSYGVDPSKFSRSLMEVCRELVQSGQFRPHLPGQLLSAAYQTLQKRWTESAQQRAEVVGSSTACLVVLDKTTNRIHTANLGDSGFLVVRNGKVVHRSTEQCHYFNAPFQLALPPQEQRHFLCDSPESAETSSFVVEEGDLVLVATDGLFDNLPLSRIETQLHHIQDEAGLQAACNSLALQARRLAFDAEFMSPFAEKAQSYGITTSGGKPDDVTLLIALVTSENQATPPRPADAP